MTWVAWRQQRLQLLLTLVVILAVTGVLVYFRIDAVAYLRAHGIEGCRTADEARCDAAALSAFGSEYRAYVSLFPLVLLCLPVLLGMFAGAPLFAREFEQGTHIFALTQSVGRVRWWTTKLVVAAVPVLVGTAVLGLVGAWALRPFSVIAHGRMMTPGFETQGLVVMAYTALAIALGATAGLLWRNTVAAMALTIVCYLVLLVGVAGTLRASYVEPARAHGAVEAGAAIGSRSGRSVVPDDAWRLSTVYYDAAGTATAFDPSSCTEADRSIENCLRRQDIASLTASYHPDNRFWRMQLIESAIFLAVGASLLCLGAWALIRRR
ncbi:hypothetical protein [Luedemannella helvata]|uniref:Transporter n=1 Tax=Luedemannella helvata TaxID=349315 RepID=A0ABP4WY96_9ACTN